MAVPNLKADGLYIFEKNVLLQQKRSVVLLKVFSVPVIDFLGVHMIFDGNLICLIFTKVKIRIHLIQYLEVN